MSTTEIQLLRSEVAQLREMVGRLFPEIRSSRQSDWDTPQRSKLRHSLIDGELSTRTFTRADIKRVAGTTDKRVDHHLRWLLDTAQIEQVSRGVYRRKATT